MQNQPNNTKIKKPLSPTYVVSAIVFILILMSFWPSYGVGYFAAMRNVSKALKKYISEHQGQMPTSKKDFLESNALEKPNQLSLVKVNYNLQIDDVSLKNDRLINKFGFKTQIIKSQLPFQIDPFIMAKTTKLSREIYLEMLKHKNKN